MPVDNIIAYSAFILLLIILSGIFSGSETALTSASRGKLKIQAERGNKGAQKALKITSNRKRLIGGVLLGNNLVNILAASVATNMFVAIFGDSGVLITTLVMTTVLLIFAEILPKSYAIARPELAAHKASRVIAPFIVIFSPVVSIIEFFVTKILGLLGIAENKSDSIEDVQEEIIGRIELEIPSGMFDREDQMRVSGALDFPNRTVEEVMRHRSEIEVLNCDDKFESILAQCLQTPHSRLPVYQNQPENIIKIAHVKDLYRNYWKMKENETSEPTDGRRWHEDLKDPYFIRETTPLGVQMQDFLDKRTHFALVVDEYGAIQGLVTLEDIIEEIVGEIVDEHDPETVPELIEERAGQYRIDGSVTVREINRQLNTEFPQDQAVTIAGLLISKIQQLPEVGEMFSFFGYQFEVLGRVRNRITELRITKDDAAHPK